MKSLPTRLMLIALLCYQCSGQSPEQHLAYAVDASIAKMVALSQRFEEMGNQLNTTVNEMGNQLNTQVEEMGNQLNMKAEEMGTQMNIKFEELHDRMTTMEEMGNHSNTKVEEMGNQLNTKVEEMGTQMNIKFEELHDRMTTMEDQAGVAEPFFVNIAPGKKYFFSSLHRSATADKAVDEDDLSMFHSGEDLTPWWMIDFGEERTVYGISILPRRDCCHERFHDVEVRLGNNLKGKGDFSNHALLTSYSGPYTLQEGVLNYIFLHGKKGRYLSIKIVRNGREFLQLNTVKIFALEA